MAKQIVWYPPSGLSLVVAWIDKFFVVFRGKSEFSVEFVKSMRDTVWVNTPIKYLRHALWKYVTSHLPYRAVVFDNEPYFIHTNPPYSSELHPCNLCLFSRLKIGLNFYRFSSLKYIQQKATAGPRTIASGMSRSSSTNWGTTVDILFVQKVSTVCDWPRVCI